MSSSSKSKGGLEPPHSKFNTKNPREAAYLALLASSKEEAFISDLLDQWRLAASPSKADFQFARQIAYGTSQMALALDNLAAQMADKGKLSLKSKERLLMRLSLFQYFFLDRIPLYAIASESLKLARK